MAREVLTDEQWEQIRPLLPPQTQKTGRPAKDHRTVVQAILWIDRTGAPWRDLPQEFGPWQSIATRLYRWTEAGVWDHVLAELQRQEDACGELDWDLHHVDGTSVRAHAPARRRCESRRESRCSRRGILHERTEPPEEDPQQREALGRSRGGFSTKIHLRAKGRAKSITFLISAGQRHEQSYFEALMEQGAVKRQSRG
jgi:transposase